MSLHEYLMEDPQCDQLLKGAVLAVGPMLEEPDPEPTLALLEEWTFDLAGRMPLPWNFHFAIDVLNHYLFQEVGLEGDQETYDDPANAAIPLVIARKRGMPITLSILWMDVARRLGFNAVGVALPGHFITGLRTDLGILHFDPFNGGRALGQADAARLVEQATGGRSSFDPAMLLPVSNRAILIRLVRNLHVRFLRAHAWSEALWTSTHLVLLSPEESLPYRDRAFVHFKRGEMTAGMKDLNDAIRLGQDLDPELVQWMEKLQRG
ncbi:MAG: transglutaminase-like domain-containing protein [Holophaga sp.]|nr:transglutaminase-like domain-containing protein [Holophaga sp.]